MNVDNSVGRALEGGAAAIVSGRAHEALAQAIAGALGRCLATCDIEGFPDGELTVAVDERLRGRDVYVVQPTAAPVGENTLELALVADALHRVGVARVTALLPYFGFARQERRAHPGEPLGARVAADLVSCGRFARVVTVDLHAPSVEGFFAVPVENMSAATLLADAARRHAGEGSVIVAPDLGGAKLARAYARELDRRVVIVHKTRLSGRRVEVNDVVGDVKGRSVVVVDDMISTGGTIAAAVAALRERGATGEVTVVATHAVLAGDAVDVLARARITRLITTDTLPPRGARAAPEGAAFERTVVSVAPLLADAVRRLAADHAVASSARPPAR